MHVQILLSFRVVGVCHELNVKPHEIFKHIIEGYVCLGREMASLAESQSGLNE